ncbi:MAG TPA: DUF2158 domain-containing protein [Bradyrhizobium sp.]|nr:DUF2158 domain-containing protein [Bradyrhizobium sp.]
MTNRYDAARPDQPEEQVMDLKPGDVVILKSGGHPLSVAEVGEDGVECVWMGSEGDLYRETLPLAVLEIAETDPDDDEEENEDEDNGDEEDDDEDEHESKVA